LNVLARRLSNFVRDVRLGVMSKLNYRVLIGGLAILRGLWIWGAPLAAKADEPAIDLARQLNQAFIQVAEQVSPAVVVITVTQKVNHSAMFEEDNPMFDLLPPQLRERDGHRPRMVPLVSQGSGVVIREDGYLLTNSHVVEGAEKIKVRFKDGKEYDAQIRGLPDAQSDLAVLKINAKGLKVAKLGDSDKTRVGEFAIAIGAPFDLDYSVTFGHVSAKGRSQIIPDARMDQDFIQTDAAINPGNSGGPLVNINSEVIGINTLIRGMNTGIGFAVPINMAKEVSDQLIKDGRFTRSWLGVGIRGLSEDRDYRELIKGIDQGVVVRQIPTNGPAAKSDLRPTDVITALDGHPVATAQELKSQVRAKKPGDMVTLDVFRAGRNLKIKVQTEAMPDEKANNGPRRLSGESAAAQNLGIKVQALTPDLAEQFGTAKKRGVIVTEVTEDSLAAREIKPGDLITEINQKPVGNPREFRDAVKAADLKKELIVNLVSDGAASFVILKDSGD
jgi:serine protease Do